MPLIGFLILLLAMILFAASIYVGYTRYGGQVEKPAPPEPERKCFRYTEDGKRHIAYEGSEMYDLILKALNRRGR